MVLSPVWVISSLDQDEHKFLEEKLNKQFRAISQCEFGPSFDEDSRKWWTITNIGGIGRFTKTVDDPYIDKVGHPVGLPVYDDQTATAIFDLNTLTVIFYGRSDDFLKNIKFLNLIRNPDRLLQGSQTAQVHYYGLCSVSKGTSLSSDLKKEFKKLPSSPSLFDKILFQGDNNRGLGKQSMGFAGLIDEEDKKNPRHHIHDYAVQIISFLSLSKEKIKKTPHQGLFQTVGTFALTFESDLLINNAANELSESILKRFNNNTESEHWKNAADADGITTIQKERGWKNLYVNLKDGFEVKDEDLDKLFPKPEISPWTLVSKLIIPRYFRKYVCSYIEILKENVHAFSTDTTFGYGQQLANNFDELVVNDLPKDEIKNHLMEIWKYDSLAEKAMGLQQSKDVLAKLRTFYENQKNAIINLKKRKAPDEKNNLFPDPKDFPFKNMGEFTKNFERFWANDGNKVVYDQDHPEDARGAGVLRKLKRILDFHPIPLSLMVRSVLTGIFLPIVIWAILTCINDQVLNTAFLEKGVGMYILFGGVFIISILCGLGKYAISVLARIKARTKEYIGWNIYKIQMFLYHQTLTKAEEYYDYCLKCCDAVENNLTQFEIAETSPLVNAPSLFEQTKFQRNVFGKIDDEYPVIAEGAVEAKASVQTLGSGTNLQNELINVDLSEDKEKENEELYAKLFRTILCFKRDSDLRTALEEILFALPADPSEKVGWNKRKQDFLEKLQTAISQQLGLYVKNNKVESVEGALFPSSEQDCLYKCELQGVPNSPVSLLIQSRFAPAVHQEDAAALKFCYYLAPSYTEKWKTTFCSDTCTVDYIAGPAYWTSFWNGENFTSIDQLDL